jgi:hypothetical protein
MNISSEKKSNPVLQRISFGLVLVFSIIILIFNIFYNEKLTKINFFLKKSITYSFLSFENIFDGLKYINFNSRFFFDNLILTQELYNENLKAKKEIEILEKNFLQALNLSNFVKKIDQIDQNLKKFNFIPGLVFFDSKDEIIVMLEGEALENLKSFMDDFEKFFQNNLILDHNGPIAKVRKTFKLDKKFFIFAQKISHESFIIPVIINNKNIGILNGKRKIIENLSSFSGLSQDDEVFLMEQPEKIPSGIKIGAIKNINNDSIKIQIDGFESRNHKKNKGESVVMVCFN